MFVAAGENNTLNLYYSDDLLRGWKPHPSNPIVKYDKHVSRPGGRVFSYGDRLYRMAPDDDPSYGIQVFALGGGSKWTKPLSLKNALMQRSDSRTGQPRSSQAELMLRRSL
jgi:hypothetical protein